MEEVEIVWKWRTEEALSYKELAQRVREEFGVEDYDKHDAWKTVKAHLDRLKEELMERSELREKLTRIEREYQRNYSRFFSVSGEERIDTRETLIALLERKKKLLGIVTRSHNGV